MTIKEKITVDRVPEHAGGPKVELEGLKRLSILFGKNGSGKSILLRSIAENAPNSTHYCNPEKAGNFAYDSNLYESESNAKDRFQQRNKNINPNYYQQVVTRIQSFLTKRGAWTDGVAPVSHLDIERLIALLLPDYKITITTEKPYIRVATQAKSKETEVKLNDLSSGERHILGLALDVASICCIWKLENSKNNLVLIDEPDAHLHPDLHQNFALFLKTLIEEFEPQVIVSTHSSTLLAALGHYLGGSSSVFYIKKGSKRQKALPLSEIQRELASILGGHALMGPLFGVPLLLVEGDDDYRIWSQVPRHHKYSFAVVPCDGEEIYKFQKTLELIFDSILSSKKTASAFALLDSDKALPDPTVVPQKHVRFIQLSCHESENLYLTGEVLSRIGTTWEAAQTSIVSQAEQFGNKKDALKDAKNWNRKKQDIKALINEVAKVLDQKNVHWTTRIGQVIGAGVSGELEDFLGTNVMASILNEKNGQEKGE